MKGEVSCFLNLPGIGHRQKWRAGAWYQKEEQTEKESMPRALFPFILEPNPRSLYLAIKATHALRRGAVSPASQPWTWPGRPRVQRNNENGRADSAPRFQCAETPMVSEGVEKITRWPQVRARQPWAPRRGPKPRPRPWPRPPSWGRRQHRWPRHRRCRTRSRG
jgi:hypothetical protein